MNINEIRKTYYKVLKNDTTINGTTYLNKGTRSKCIFNGRRINKTNPSMTVSTFPSSPSVFTEMYDGQIIITFFTDPLDMGYVDLKRQGLIQDRINTLFSDVNLTRSGYLIQHSHVISTDIGQFDLQNSEEHYGFSRIEFMAIKT